jgi:nitrogen fixation protein NifQ
MTDAVPLLSKRQRLQHELLARPAFVVVRDDPNRPILASLLAGRACAEGMLPAHLGLSDDEYAQLWRDYFAGPPLPLSGDAVAALPESAGLLKLFLTARARRFPSEAWCAKIVVTACAGKDHLWRDLGLTGRPEVTQLLSNAFPTLAQKNDNAIRWKKFIYHTYRAHEGLHDNLTPSCSECDNYAHCFAAQG